MSVVPSRRGPPRVLAVLGATVLTAILLAAPAAAHPAFDPDRVPVDSLVETTLAMAHGCRSDADDEASGEPGEDGQGAPTREVAIEVPDAVTHVEPAEREGWDLEVEREGDAVEVVVYTAREGTDERAPAFDLRAVHRGAVGDEVHWRVVQTCDEGAHRWVGTGTDTAEEPAVTVTLVEADPQSPPPAEGSDGRDAPSDGGEAPQEAPEEPEAEGAGDDPTGPVDGPAGEDPATEDAAQEGGPPGWLLIVVLVAVPLVAGTVLALRGRGGEAGAGGAGSAGEDRGGAGPPA